MLLLPWTSPSFSGFLWKGSAVWVVAVGASWVSVWPSVCSHSPRAVVGTPGREPHSFSVCLPSAGCSFSLRSTGSSSRQERQVICNCAFIFIHCSQGIGCVTAKNNLIINPCLHSKFRLSVPALQSLLAAVLFWSSLDRHGLGMLLAPVGNVVPVHILGNGHNSGKLLCSALDSVFVFLITFWLWHHVNSVPLVPV